MKLLSKESKTTENWEAALSALPNLSTVSSISKIPNCDQKLCMHVDTNSGLKLKKTNLWYKSLIQILIQIFLENTLSKDFHENWLCVL